MNKGIQKIFAEVPETYEMINHILTFSMDILWRRRAAKIAAANGGTRWIDMCTGTGETARYLRKFGPENPQIFAADFSLPMLSEAISKSRGKHIRFLISDVNKLPFCDNTFDLITISFATRNINLNRHILIQCLREFHRVLKPGGRFINLETSQPSIGVIRKLYHLYVHLFIKPVGAFLSGSEAGYRYLSSTIPRFYFPEELVEILRISGFSEIQFKILFFGAAAIHQARKF